MEISQLLSNAVVSLVTLAVALPIQSKAANSKALETVEKVYGNLIEKLEKRIKTLETNYASNNCDKAPNCKQRVK